jgi:hypothetical protein
MPDTIFAIKHLGIYLVKKPAWMTGFQFCQEIRPLFPEWCINTVSYTDYLIFSRKTV